MMPDQNDICNEQYAAACELRRPCIMFRPSLSIDGNKWCALYGANLQDGVAGFGDTPDSAMWDFDKAWHAKLEPSKPVAQDDLLARTTSARDALADELKRIEAAVDAAGGTKFENTPDFIKRLAEDRDVALAVCNAVVAESMHLPNTLGELRALADAAILHAEARPA